MRGMLRGEVPWRELEVSKSHQPDRPPVWSQGRAWEKPEPGAGVEAEVRTGPGRSRGQSSCWLSGRAARPGLARARRPMDRVSPLRPHLPRKPSGPGSLLQSRAWWALWLVQV